VLNSLLFGVVKKSPLIFVVCFQLVICFVYPVSSRAGDAYLNVNFDLNKFQIRDEEKIRIHNFLKDNRPAKTEKILVIGFTDSTGPEALNYGLSEKRAQAVKNEIIAYAKSKSNSVSVDGFGPNAPLSNNKFPAGRARNRRAELYLTGVKDWRLQHLSSVKNHNKTYIFKYIGAAKTSLFKDQFDQALLSLKKAAQLGGEDYSDWHLTYGAVGFYAGRPLQQLKPIFNRALELDPYNSKARDFLGRIKAREDFVVQELEPDMGRTYRCPIRVESHYQLYEYLRLFKVKPRARFHYRISGIERWECEDSFGNMIDYYFDCSKVQAGAFYSPANLFISK
jgi:tetratricopeptide (TPR) repeat protein